MLIKPWEKHGFARRDSAKCSAGGEADCMLQFITKYLPPRNTPYDNSINYVQKHIDFASFENSASL